MIEESTKDVDLSEAPIGLIDLDGTLADFDKAMTNQMQAIAHPSEGDIRSKLLRQSDEPDYIKARRRLIKSQPGFWRTLPRFELGFQILHVMQMLKFNVHVLTNGPKNPAAAWQEKREWCDDNVSELPVIVGRNKGLVYGRALADDWPEYILLWLAHRPRGFVAMPAQEWNVDFKHPNVLRYDGTNYSELVTRLAIARNRRSGP
jgi:5'-nucleotidase